MSCRCLEPKCFVGDPTLLTRDSKYDAYIAILGEAQPGQPPPGYYPQQGALPQGQYPPQGAAPGVYPPPAQDMSGYAFFPYSIFISSRVHNT